ncbi:PadR family transcriptional regulator [Pseudorhizobium flavum]|uniref:PadR family transcriptional regulator n=1 Tax=Pseudorhizobium flavum TaxID=1335061 RepID=UPI0024922B3F|nr:helix-turn-helix transcriptional regulator [Pseudorhizobium flavum]
MAKDAKISGPVLLALEAIGPARNGICESQIMHATGLPPDALHPLLQRLEEAGWLASEWEADAASQQMKRPKRRLYTMTDAGRSKRKELASTLLNNAR